MCLCLSRKRWSLNRGEADEEKEKHRRYGVFQSVTELDRQVSIKIKTEEEEKLIKTAVENNDFISRVISGELLKATVAVMYKRDVKVGETIIKRGNTGSHMYVSCKGTFEIITPKLKTTFNDVRIFGELAIIYNAKRLATIRAVTDAAVWVLDAPVYQNLLERYHVKEQDERVNFLIKNDVLKDAGPRAIKLAANSLTSQFFTGGKNIITEGDKGSRFYVVRAGSVTVKTKAEGMKGTFGRGYCFGERALLKETRRQATVIANPPLVECLTLSRKQFFELTEYLKIKQSNVSKASINLYENIELKDLQVFNIIGIGGFGCIELVKLRDNKNQIFAMKKMNKHSIVQDNRQQQALNEKMQIDCHSPFIVRMYKTFRDTRYLYYLLEYCPGGDLWDLLYKQQIDRRFKENDAKFTVGCVLEALDYLHKKEIIYRDLKPENVLLSPTGYFKLTDFGYIKKLAKYEKTFTFAGTVEYVAPEVLQKKTYDRTVDFWACGIFIFELLCGKSPFSTFDGNENKIFKNILNGIDQITFPKMVTPLAKELVVNLCRPTSEERLGHSGGIQDIKNHKWFAGFSWQKLQRLEMNSPFKFQARSYRGKQFQPEIELPPEDTDGWDADF